MPNPNPSRVIEMTPEVIDKLCRDMVGRPFVDLDGKRIGSIQSAWFENGYICCNTVIEAENSMLLSVGTPFHSRITRVRRRESLFDIGVDKD